MKLPANSARSALRARRSRRPEFEGLDRRNLPSAIGFHPATGILHAGKHPHEARPATAEVGSTTPDPAPKAGPARSISNIAYTGQGSGAEHLDLYLPAGTPPPGGWPVVLAFPGGGWRWASRQQYGQGLSVLTGHGFAVAAVDVAYASSTVNGSHAWPANLQDAERAVTWVNDHAARLHLDAGKIVAMGDSAGANMALLLGTYPAATVALDSPPAATGAPASHIAAVVDFYGPADMTTLFGQSRTDALPYIETYLGGTRSQVPGRYAAASPVTYINGNSPPVLIVQGGTDHTVPLAQSLELDAALTKAGVSHQLVTIPWATHGFGLNLPGYDLTTTVVRFLDAALGLPATGGVKATV
jgi:acetyl esterase/lipase